MSPPPTALEEGCASPILGTRIFIRRASPSAASTTTGEVHARCRPACETKRNGSGAPKRKGRLRQSAGVHSGGGPGLLSGAEISELRQPGAALYLSRAAKKACDEGRGVGPGGRGVDFDFSAAIRRLGEDAIRERYGNLFEMYERITGENAYRRRCAFFRPFIMPWAARGWITV